MPKEFLLAMYCKLEELEGQLHTRF